MPGGVPVGLQEIQDVARLDVEVARQLLNFNAASIGSDKNSFENVESAELGNDTSRLGRF